MEVIEDIRPNLPQIGGNPGILPSREAFPDGCFLFVHLRLSKKSLRGLCPHASPRFIKSKKKKKSGGCSGE
jgi:hypothetical protein